MPKNLFMRDRAGRFGGTDVAFGQGVADAHIHEEPLSTRLFQAEPRAGQAIANNSYYSRQDRQLRVLLNIDPIDSINIQKYIDFFATP